MYIDLGEIPWVPLPHGYRLRLPMCRASVKRLATGGRYDHVGEAFGRSRPATGFAIDLKSLVSQGQSEVRSSGGIFAPYSTDRESQYQVDSLRGQGKRVVQGFEGQRMIWKN